MAYKDEILKQLSETHLTWEDAFSKFGYDDGDGMVITGNVAAFIESLGYDVGYDVWGMHNTVINSIIDINGEDLLEGQDLAYGDPREYLPEQLIKQLDEWFYGKE
jgi:hypothetical protein